MSTVMVLSFPAPGHVNPTLPVVAELVRRGERVVYYSLEEFRPAVQGVGAEFHAYGPDCPLGSEDGCAAALADDPNPFAMIGRLLETSRWALDHLVAEVRSHRPAYLIYDTLSPWGAHLAQVLDLPSVASVPTILVDAGVILSVPSTLLTIARWSLPTGRQAARIRGLLASLANDHGISPPRRLTELLSNFGTLNLVYTSAEFQPHAGRFDAGRFKFVGPALAPRPDDPPFPFHELDGRPLVFISLGTMTRRHGEFFRTCFEAFAGTDWQVVLATANNHLPGDLRPAPANVLVRRYVPQVDLLARTTVFVTHGGVNSVSEGLSRGVPLVMVPGTMEQRWVARRVTGLGAGRTLPGGRLAPARLRRVVEEVGSRPRYARAAAEIGRSLRSAGGYVRAADEIEAFKLRLGIG